MHQLINPVELADTATDYGVAGGVVAGNTLYLSGQAPVDCDLNVVGATFAEQTEVVFASFECVLENAGFSWEDVVKINAFVSDEDPDLVTVYCAILKRYLATRSSKNAIAHTYVVTKALALPGVLIEIEGVAIRA